MDYEKGTKIRVDITGRVIGSQINTDAPPGSLLTTTYEVMQTENGEWYHFLYLNSDSVAGIKQTGGTVTARFDAVVTGRYQEGRYSTTEIRETNGFTHFLFLGSEAVTVLEEAPAEPASQPEPEPAFTEPEPVPAPFAKGTRIRVAIDGVIYGKTDYSLSATTPVRQTGNLRTHSLFLGSDLVTTGDSRDEGTLVSARFDATVTGDYQEINKLTQVEEIRRLASGDSEYAGYAHYLYLDSDAITVLPPPGEPEPVPESTRTRVAVEIESATLEEARKLAGLEWNPEAVPVQRSVGGERITPAAVEIESADVLKRIAELEDAAPAAFRLVRNRSKGQLTPVFPSMTAALAYLDEEDLDPERFTVKEVIGELTGDDQKELNQLRKLNDAGRLQFGSTPWITAGVLLRRDEDCDDDWAQDQARAELNVPYVDVWPLDQIDWSAAATDLLESKYLTVDFNGTTYWGKYTG